VLVSPPLPPPRIPPEAEASSPWVEPDGLGLQLHASAASPSNVTVDDESALRLFGMRWQYRKHTRTSQDIVAFLRWMV
jgi:hypothetical protein